VKEEENREKDYLEYEQEMEKLKKIR